MKSRLLTFPLLLAAVGPLTALAQESPEARLDEVRADLDAGRFVTALEGMESLLTGAPSRSLLDRIALITGELYPVTEVSTDGGAVRWSRDGRYAAYESGSGSSAVTHVLAEEEGELREIATIQGGGLVFSPSAAAVAYLTLVESPELSEARARLERELGGEDRSSRMRLRTEMARLEAQHTQIVERDLQSGQERPIRPTGVAVSSLFYGPDGRLYLAGTEEGVEDRSDLFQVDENGAARRVTEGPGRKSDAFFAGPEAFLVYTTGRGSFSVLEVASGRIRDFQGSAPVLSPDGSTLAFLSADGEGGSVQALSLTDGNEAPRVVAQVPFGLSMSGSRSCAGCPLLSGLAVSPDGNTVAFQGMEREDWEIYLAPVTGSTTAGDGAAPTRLTWEIQHDIYPQFLADGRLLTAKGEGRHRRSYLYDTETGQATWLFRNNTLRTVAPEYEWAPSPDGSKILIVAERDGNTVSPERGVYLLDLSRKVDREEILARVRRNLAAEKDLRQRAEVMFTPVADRIRSVLAEVSMSRIFRDEEALYGFGSKYITNPGNGKAIEYIVSELQTAGYQPALQWFEPRGARTANIVVTLPGTVSPEVVYAVSAHFDSNTRSPGADDNTSATVGLLEMARVLAGKPLPATVEIAFFTGEEAGLLGSREYVRRAVESGKHLVGALNNDMVGFAEDHRLDNTIRYSNKGIRDLQHGAAILFSQMVTHDAEYYKSTDAAAYYDAYGDIVGGIGSYPILASPHYHQVSDVLETVNHQLITEVSKVTTASIMLMASSPSRLEGLEAVRDGGEVAVTWIPAVEADVTGYRVAYGPEDEPLANSVTVQEPSARLTDVPAGSVISVKALNRRGMEGWDWARVTVND